MQHASMWDATTKAQHDAQHDARTGGCRKEERKAKLADAAQEAKEDGKAVETDALQSGRTVPEGQVGTKRAARPWILSLLPLMRTMPEDRSLAGVLLDPENNTCTALHPHFVDHNQSDAGFTGQVRAHVRQRTEAHRGGMHSSMALWQPAGMAAAACCSWIALLRSAG